MHSLPYRAAYLVGLFSLIFKLKFENRCCGTLHIANHVQWNVCIGVLPICPWPNIDKLRDDLGSPRIDRTFSVGGQEIRVCHLLYNLQTWEAEVMLSWRPKSHQKKKKSQVLEPMQISGGWGQKWPGKRKIKWKLPTQPHIFSALSLAPSRERHLLLLLSSPGKGSGSLCQKQTMEQRYRN